MLMHSLFSSMALHANVGEMAAIDQLLPELSELLPEARHILPSYRIDSAIRVFLLVSFVPMCSYRISRKFSIPLAGMV